MAYPGFLVLTSEEYEDPQPLFVDGESLGVNRDIGKNGAFARFNREARVGDFVNKGEKPSGAITYTFRSSDILKPLFAHFQCGTVEALGTYRYVFYPLTAPTRNQTSGAYSIGTYGMPPGRTYFLRATKKLVSGAPVSYFYGVSDKLEFNFQTEETSSVTANFLFKDFTVCENTIAIRDTIVVENAMDTPSGSLAGTYASTEAFNFSDVAIQIAGTSFPIEKLTFASDQGVQTVKTVGKRNPSQYLQGNYSVRGKFSFDLPANASTLIGSMLTMGTFAIVGTAYHNSADRLSFSMPTCMRQPFDFTASASLTSKGEIPFEAVSANGTPALTITVDTVYGFNPMLGVVELQDRTTNGTIVQDRTSNSDVYRVTT